MRVVDLFFPQTCINCGKSGGYLCKYCLSQVPFAETTCPVCRRFSFYGKTHDQCMTDVSLNGLVSVWEYKGVIRKAISAIKYKFAYNITPTVTSEAAKEIKKFKLSTDSLCVAVPLYRSRANWRGFNQSADFAQYLSNDLGWTYVPHVLERTSKTTPQVQLTVQKRLRNMRGKIAVNTTILNKIDTKRPLVIVDDVWTTGATIKECAKVLKLAGFREVIGVTIAKA